MCWLWWQYLYGERHDTRGHSAARFGSAPNSLILGPLREFDLSIIPISTTWSQPVHSHSHINSCSARPCPTTLMALLWRQPVRIIPRFLVKGLQDFAVHGARALRLRHRTKVGTSTGAPPGPSFLLFPPIRKHRFSVSVLRDIRRLLRF